MKNDFFWFYIEAYVHISIKQNKFLLYNTLNNKYYIGDLKPEIKKLFSKIRKKDNLRVIKLTQEDLRSKNIHNFMEKTRKLLMGDILKSSFSEKKPIQFTPFINISEEIKWNSKNEITEGKNIIDNLHEITIYINNSNCIELEKYADANLQFIFFLYDTKYFELNLVIIKQLLEVVKESNLFKINISGGNIFTYKKISELIYILNKENISIVYYTHYSFLPFLIQNKELLGKLNENPSNRLNIYITDFDKNNNLRDEIWQIKNISNFIFVIKSDLEFIKANTFIERNNIDKFEFKPYFNTKNLSFFKKNIFIGKTDILNSNFSQKDILIKRKINPILFGKLTVMNNGDLYSNVNKPISGNIKKDTIHEIIYNELSNSSSWLLTRNKIYPCKKCLYCYLCPPISNYELTFNQNNLCKIN